MAPRQVTGVDSRRFHRTDNVLSLSATELRGDVEMTTATTPVRTASFTSGDEMMKAIAVLNWPRILDNA